MGDLAILHEAQRADRIFDKMADAADALLRVAKAFGLSVNLAAGKTQAVLGLHRPGWRPWKPCKGMPAGCLSAHTAWVAASGSWMLTSTLAGTRQPAAV